MKTLYFLPLIAMLFLAPAAYAKDCSNACEVAIDAARTVYDVKHDWIAANKSATISAIKANPTLTTREKEKAIHQADREAERCQRQAERDLKSAKKDAHNL